MLIKNLLRDCPEFVAGDHTRLRELLNPHNDPNFPGRYSLAHAVVDVGKASTPHRMITNEVYYILNGDGVMHIDNESSAIHKGDVLSIPPNATQWIENTGTDSLVFICIVDPAWRKEDEIVM